MHISIGMLNDAFEVLGSMESTIARLRVHMADWAMDWLKFGSKAGIA